MPDSIALSVIIPTYNMQPCIDRCVQSVIQQKGKYDIEVIIVDDDSADHTEQVVAKLSEKHPFVRYIKQKKRAGVSAARNAGLRAARGMYIHFVDCDDRVPEGAYSEALRHALADKADIVTCNYIYKCSSKESTVVYMRDTGLGRCLENNNLSLCNRLFKRSFLINNNLWLKEGMATAEDAYLICQALRLEPSISSVNTALYEYYFDDTDEERHCFRDLHITSLENSLTVLRTFAEPFSKETSLLWAEAFLNYLGFIHNNVWVKMLNTENRCQGFEMIKQALADIQKKNPACNLLLPANEERFLSIFVCDYAALQALSYQQYLQICALRRIPQVTFVQPDAPAITRQFIQNCGVGQVCLSSITCAIRTWLGYKIRHLKRR